MNPPLNQPKEIIGHFIKNNRIRRTGLIFDDMSFVAPFDSEEDAKIAIKVLASMKQTDEVSFNIRTRYEDYIKIELYLPLLDPTRKHALVQIIISAARLYLKIEYCPAKVDDRVYENLHQIVKNISDYESFDEFRLSAHITRVDVCYDFIGLDIRKHVFNTKRFQKRKGWTKEDSWSEDHYSPETVSFGVRGGNSVCIYDKVKKDPTAYPEETCVTRFEYRIRPAHTGFYLRDLLTLENRFPRIQIFNPDFIQAPSAPSGFFNLWRRIGLRRAFKRRGVPKNAQKKILDECAGGTFLYWIAMEKMWDADLLAALKKYNLYEIALISRDMQNTSLAGP